MKRIVLAGIRGYRRFLSPLLGQHCRFIPSCSEYGLMAVEEWGAVRGSLLSAWRILRCNPFSAGGLDLPPRRGDAPSGQSGVGAPGR